MTDGATRDSATESDSPSVLVVGAGVAGLTAGVFTARAGLDATVVDGGEPILARNAFLENFPGFPTGVNARRLLEMLRDQAERSGCRIEEGRITAVRETRTDAGVDAEPDDDNCGGEGDGRLAVTVDGEERHVDYVVCTSWSDTEYLAGTDVGLVSRGSKTYVDVDERGWTGVDGLYAAGRLAEKPHQAIVCAGHGAEVAVTLLEDDDRPFYHDWVAPEGYFTDRGRDLPPGCEEIGEEERHRREDHSRDTMREWFAEPHPDEQETHPSLVE